VVVGAGAKILGAIEIGEGSRIGANAVVVKSVPQNSVVVGVPGQIVVRSEPRTGLPDLDHNRLPDAISETIKSLVERLEELEKIAHSFNGVDKCFAIQAGREIRIMVENEKISDNDTVMLCNDIIKKIETEMTYPGQIKVTVIRETRVSNFAK